MDSSVMVVPRHRGLIAGMGKRVFLFHTVHIGLGTHPTSCSIGTLGSFPEGEAAGA